MPRSVVEALLDRVRSKGKKGVPTPGRAPAPEGRSARPPLPSAVSVRAGGLTVIGIDPGTIRCGWGIVRREGTKLVHIAHGIVRLDEKAPISDRLVVLERELELVVLEHRPTAASIESIFFSKDAQAAAKLGHARGVAVLVCARHGLSIHEYPPARVKRTITGSGRADKLQVAQMAKTLLRLAELPRADAADALAIALTHLHGTR